MFHEKVAVHDQHPKGKVFAWIAFFSSLGISIAAPFFTPYLQELLQNESLVGMVATTAGLAQLIISILLATILARFGRIRILIISLAVLAGVFIFYPFITTFIHAQVIRAMDSFFFFLVIAALMLLLRDFVESEQLEREEGRYYRFTNMGWFLGPLLGGVLFSFWGYSAAFIGASVGFIITFFFVSHQHFIQEHQSLRLKSNARHYISLRDFVDYFSNKKRFAAFVANTGDRFFFDTMWIFGPIVLVQKGMPVSYVGYLLGFTCIILVIGEKWTGDFAIRWGAHKALTLGFLIAAVSVFAAFFLPLEGVAAMFLLSCVGGAFLEPVKEPLFFSGTPKRDENRFTGIYQLSRSLSFFISPIIFSLYFLFFPLDSMFLLWSFLLVLFGVAVWWIAESENK